jgi:hypothetical protein
VMRIARDFASDRDDDVEVETLSSISFHRKWITDLRGGVEKRHSSGEVPRSIVARF